MARSGHTDRSPGMGLAARFTLAMASGLLVVGGVGAVLLHSTSKQVFERQAEDLLRESIELSARAAEKGYQPLGRKLEQSGRVQMQPVTLTDGTAATKYDVEPDADGRQLRVSLFVPDERERKGLFGLMATLIGLMIAVGVGIAWWIAGQVTRPLQDILQAVRRLSHGDLRYRGRIEGGGEVALLSRSLERMTTELESARETELELSVRERELELAAELRENLLPLATPLVPGHDLAAMHLATTELSGSFHDFLELEDGRIGLLVCDVSGDGVPAAMVGAMARAALRSELVRGDELAPSLARVNRELFQAVKRGMFVTALYVLVDPNEERATVACAGHRLPLVRWSAADGSFRVFQPEGIALALDAGPVFERSLEVQGLEFQPGDRLVLSTAGAAAVCDPSGRELGEKPLWQRMQRHIGEDAGRFVKRVREELEHFAGDEPLPQDVSIVCLCKES